MNWPFQVSPFVAVHVFCALNGLRNKGFGDA